MTPPTYNHDNKFDIQLSAALVHERRLGEIFAYKDIKIELKSESYMWERTGNICIEFMFNGKASGLTATKADYWAHELLRDGETLCYLMFPIKRLQKIACDAADRGAIRHQSGDGGKSSVILLALRDIIG